METNQIHIFKTDIKELCPNCQVHKMLTNHPEVQQWNLDLEDIDNVLRIESATLTPDAIITIINQFGHECQELQ